MGILVFWLALLASNFSLNLGADDFGRNRQNQGGRNPSSHRSNRQISARLDFYDHVLLCKPLTLQCLINEGLVDRISENVFIVRGEESTHLEVHSAKKIAKELKLPILLSPNLPDFDGVPAIDGIVFDSYGHPIANLGIKTHHGQSNNATTKLKASISKSVHSVDDHLNADFFADRFGFDSFKDGEILKAYRDLPDHEYKEKLVHAVFHLYGIDAEQREVWLAYDFSINPSKHLRIIEGESSEVSFKGNFIFIEDLSKGPPTKKTMVHLESLIQRIKEHPVIKRHLIFTSRSYLSIDSKNFKLVHQNSCERALN